jgi:hypothetical protein
MNINLNLEDVYELDIVNPDLTKIAFESPIS